VPVGIESDDTAADLDDEGEALLPAISGEPAV